MKLAAFVTNISRDGHIVPVARHLPPMQNSPKLSQDPMVTLPLLSHSALHRRRFLEQRDVTYHPSTIFSNKDSRIQAYRKRYPRAAVDTSSYYNADDNYDETSALYEGYGTHYVDLWVGTPPQRQTVIVDTGSGVTAFPCKGCSNCGSDYHASDFFQQDASTSFHSLTCSECNGGSCRQRSQNTEYCSISVSYAEGSSWSAFQATDMTYMGGAHFTPLSLKHVNGTIYGADPSYADEFRFNMLFGCQTSITGLFITQLADGIMGMSNGGQAIWRQMKNAGVIKSGQFSLCYSLSAEEIVKNGTHAGAITIGGTDTNLHQSRMVFAAAHKISEFHGLHIRKVYFLDPQVQDWDQITNSSTTMINISETMLNNNGVILDSGTTDTYITSSIANAFRQAWLHYVDVPYNINGMSLTQDQLEKLPTILFQFQGVDGNGFDPDDPDRCVGLAGCLDPDNPNDVLVAVPLYQYMTFSPQSKLYEPTIFINEPRQTVIGANVMAGHNVLFDTDGSNRIGFAVSNCSYNELLKSTPTEIPTGSNNSKPYGSPTLKPTTAPKSPTGSAKSTGSDSQSGVGFIIAFLLILVLIVIVVIKRRRKRVQRGRYRQTIGLDELELDENEDLELPPVL